MITQKRAFVLFTLGFLFSCEPSEEKNLPALLGRDHKTPSKLETKNPNIFWLPIEGPDGEIKCFQRFKTLESRPTPEDIAEEKSKYKLR